MTAMTEANLFEAILDSWDRNNRILVNLLRSIPASTLNAAALDKSQSIGGMFAHVHYVRLVFISEDAPEFAQPLPKREWILEQNVDEMAGLLDASAQSVQNAVKGRWEAGRPMDVHYDHPIFFLQHMIWHEGYHHGQIKLALKAAGQALSDKEIGAITWRVWMNKNKPLTGA